MVGAVGDLVIPIGTADDPTLTGDLLELYWQNTLGDIVVVKRASRSAAWGPQSLVAELNSPGDDGTPEVNPDGLTIYFATSRVGGQGGLDVMRSTRPSRDVVWTAPVFVSELNAPTTENNATTDATGTQLAMTTTRAGTADVWLSRREAADLPWGRLVREDVLSSIRRDAGTFLTADGLTLYFNSDISGTADLYTSHRESVDAPFAPATRIAELSSDKADEDPWVSPDGHDIYFMRDSGLPSAVLLHATR
jgi:hypothetical protein